MNNITKEAIAEAERFIKAAKAMPDGLCFYSSKERAAAKRASMDLTRALAKFRNTSGHEWERS